MAQAIEYIYGFVDKNNMLRRGYARLKSPLPLVPGQRVIVRLSGDGRATQRSSFRSEQCIIESIETDLQELMMNQNGSPGTPAPASGVQTVDTTVYVSVLTAY